MRAPLEFTPTGPTASYWKVSALFRSPPANKRQRSVFQKCPRDSTLQVHSRMATAPADFRSDTVTKPCEGMRAAMAAAPVGDDVFRDDPTVNELQDRISSMLGFEGAVFVPTGTMSNL